MPFIPLPRGVLWLLPYPTSSVTSVDTSYRYRIVLWLLYNFHTLTRQFCNFCNNFVPVPGYGVCLSYPYLEDFCDFCTTLYPTRTFLWLLYDFHTFTWQFCNFCNKSHTLQKVPVPYRTQAWNFLYDFSGYGILFSLLPSRLTERLRLCLELDPSTNMKNLHMRT